MARSFYNTINVTGEQLSIFEDEAKRQEEILLSFFRLNPNEEFTPAQVFELKILGKAPITSVRRGMTNLTQCEEKFLVKTTNSKKGLYHVDNTCWKLNKHATIMKEHQQDEEILLFDLKNIVNNFIQDFSVGEYGPVSDRFKKLAFGLEFKNIYYAGGTLCMDTNKGETLLLNINNETISIVGPGAETKYLMPIPMIYFAFSVYKEIKGKTQYFYDCYDTSCIRHIYTTDLEKPVVDIKDILKNLNFN